MSRLEKKNKLTPNKDFSEKPGFTIFLTPGGYERARKVIDETGYIIAEEQFKQVSSDLFSLRLPVGIYGTGFGGCQLYLRAADGWGKTERIYDPMIFDYSEVVRIEGFSGERWQNHDYTPKGKPK